MRLAPRGTFAAAALAFSVGVFAQASTPAEGGANLAANTYVGGGYGQAHWRPGCPGAVPQCDDTQAALHVFAGYHINETFAAEVAFTNLGKADGPNVEVKGKAWEASVVAGLPISGRFSAIGRLGIYRGVVKGGGLFANHTETNYGATYGLGVQAAITQNLGARLEWQAFPGVGGSSITDSDVNVLSLSALWRFR